MPPSFIPATASAATGPMQSAGEGDRPANDFGSGLGDRLERELRLRPALRPAEMREQDDLRALVGKFEDGRRDAFDAGRVGDLAVGHRHVEIDADQYPLALDVADRVERLECGHRALLHHNNHLKNRADLSAGAGDARREIIAATAVGKREQLPSAGGFPSSAARFDRRPGFGSPQGRPKMPRAPGRRSRQAQKDRNARRGRRRLERQAEAPILPFSSTSRTISSIGPERDAVGIFGAAAEPLLDQRGDRQLRFGIAQAGRIGGFEVAGRPCRDRPRTRRRIRHPPDRPRCGWRTAGRAGADSGPARRYRHDRRPSGGPCPGTASSAHRAPPAKAAPSAECAAPRATGLPGTTV